MVACVVLMRRRAGALTAISSPKTKTERIAFLQCKKANGPGPMGWGDQGWNRSVQASRTGETM
jgi:hypothetical protein